jgi:hypothetical protein
MAKTTVTVNAGEHFTEGTIPKALNQTASNVAHVDLQFNLGDRVIITCDDTKTWTNGSGNNVNANGFPANGIYGVHKDTLGTGELTDGCLVGSWDGGYSFFPIGTFYQGTVCIVPDGDRASVLHKGKGLCLAMWGKPGHGKLSVHVEFKPTDRKQFNPEAFETPQWQALCEKGDAAICTVKAKEHSLCVDYVQWPNSNPLRTPIDLKVGDIVTIECPPYETWAVGTNFKTKLECDAAGIMIASNANVYEVRGEAYPDLYDCTESPTQTRTLAYTSGAMTGTLHPVDKLPDVRDRHYFPVGLFLQMTVLQEGTLLLACWETNDWNNDKAIKAYVKVQRFNAQW